MKRKSAWKKMQLPICGATGLVMTVVALGQAPALEPPSAPTQLTDLTYTIHREAKKQSHGRTYLWINVIAKGNYTDGGLTDLLEQIDSQKNRSNKLFIDVAIYSDTVSADSKSAYPIASLETDRNHQTHVTVDHTELDKIAKQRKLSVD